MKQVNIYEAKTQLSQLVERASGGEEIVIAKAGKPVARLVPLETRGKLRVPGAMKGKIRIRRGFEQPVPDALFEGPIEP